MLSQTLNNIRMIFTLGLILLAGSCPVLAGVVVSPEIIQANMDSDYYEGRFSVINNSKDDKTCVISVTDLFKENETKTNSEDVLSWISFNQSRFNLGSESEQIINFTIKTPNTVCAGIYSMSIQIKDSESGQLIGTGIIAITVGASINIEALDSNSDLGVKAEGVFSTTSRFLVDANVQSVKLFAEVVPMKKLSNEMSVAELILPDLTMNIDISPTDAWAVNHNNQAGYTAIQNKLANQSVYKSESITFRCDKQTGFRQEVLVTVWWKQDNPYMEAGKYGGQISLIANVDYTK